MLRKVTVGEQAYSIHSRSIHDHGDYGAFRHFDGKRFLSHPVAEPARVELLQLAEVEAICASQPLVPSDDCTTGVRA